MSGREEDNDELVKEIFYSLQNKGEFVWERDPGE